MACRKSLSRAQRLRVFERAMGRCHICEEKIDGVREPWDVEHVIPIEIGGADEPENMRPAHRDRCHKGKTAQDVKAIAKSKRVRCRHLGIKKPRTITRWRRFDGTPVTASRER